jgi:BirA family transcriptional regulator, biotin operon repressor / biotin---[acetyl-CoA-carboxylase] ligase
VTEDLATHERISALLSGPVLWHHLEHHAEVGSTNDVALELARAGTPPGFVVVADRQTAGRGRAGRDWQDRVSDTGPASLLCTAAVAVPEANAGLAPLAAGLALADALRRQGARPALKWPNDVLLDERKTAGILVERHGLPSGAEVLLVGIGCNLDWRGVDRPDDEIAWTSVAEQAGAAVDRGDVLADLLRGLATWLRSLPTEPLRLLIAYRDACASIGREVRVSFPDGEQLTGHAVDLDREGRLVVDTVQGPLAVNAGDVHHLRTPRQG